MRLASARATLFPYATLFRSAMQENDGRAVPRVEVADSRSIDREVAGRELGPGPLPPGQWNENPLPRQDRKSTRLNSSHTVISYAVFCLKKKKNGGIRTKRMI